MLECDDNGEESYPDGFRVTDLAQVRRRHVAGSMAQAVGVLICGQATVRIVMRPAPPRLALHTARGTRCGAGMPMPTKTVRYATLERGETLRRQVVTAAHGTFTRVRTVTQTSDTVTNARYAAGSTKGATRSGSGGGW